MSYLSSSMDTGVGAACTLEGYRLGEDGGDRRLNLCLYRSFLSLTLPAMKRSTPVLNYQDDPLPLITRRIRQLMRELRRAASHQRPNPLGEFNDSHARIVTSSADRAHNASVATLTIRVPTRCLFKQGMN